jgi:hypothetical protein
VSTQVPTGTTEPVYCYAVSVRGRPLTGLTDLYIRVHRASDGYFLDWADWTFKATGHSAINKPLVQVNASLSPGLYRLAGDFPTGMLTNANPEDSYVFTPLQTPGTNAYLPGPSELAVGWWADQVLKIDAEPTVAPSAAAPGSLLDRLCNKDASRTFDQATDSLEGLRDRIG